LREGASRQQDEIPGPSLRGGASNHSLASRRQDEIPGPSLGEAAEDIRPVFKKLNIFLVTTEDEFLIQLTVKSSYVIGYQSPNNFHAGLTLRIQLSIYNSFDFKASKWLQKEVYIASEKVAPDFFLEELHKLTFLGHLQ
jgi:hypothetical protein